MKLLLAIADPKSFPLTTEERNLLELICKSVNPTIQIASYNRIPTVCAHNYQGIPGLSWHAVDKDIVESLRRRGLLIYNSIMTYKLMTYKLMNIKPFPELVEYRICSTAMKQFPELNELRIQIALGLTYKGKNKTDD